MFGNKLSGAVEYFYYETKNFLTSPSEAEYSDPLGTSLPTVNTQGERRRAGWEFEMKYRDNIGDFRYTIGANLTNFDEMWVNNPYENEAELKNPNTRSTQQLSTGANSYISEGFYTSPEDVINNPKRNNSNNLVPGILNTEMLMVTDKLMVKILLETESLHLQEPTMV